MKPRWKQLLLINLIAWVCLAAGTALHALWLGTDEYLIAHALMIALALALVSLFDALSRQ